MSTMCYLYLYGCNMSCLAFIYCLVFLGTSGNLFLILTYRFFYLMAEESTSVTAALSKLSPDIRSMVRTVMISAEYRSAETNFQKVEILRNSEFTIPVYEACTAVGISTKTYYKNKKLIIQGEPPLERTSPNQLLIVEEERLILDAILDAQDQLIVDTPACPEGQAGS